MLFAEKQEREFLLASDWSFQSMDSICGPEASYGQSLVYVYFVPLSLVQAEMEIFLYAKIWCIFAQIKGYV